MSNLLKEMYLLYWLQTVFSIDQKNIIKNMTLKKEYKQKNEKKDKIETEYHHLFIE